LYEYGDDGGDGCDEYDDEECWFSPMGDWCSGLFDEVDIGATLWALLMRMSSQIVSADSAAVAADTIAATKVFIFRVDEEEVGNDEPDE